jgi:hypothetical protein
MKVIIPSYINHIYRLISLKLIITNGKTCLFEPLLSLEDYAKFSHELDHQDFTLNLTTAISFTDPTPSRGTIHQISCPKEL